MRRFFGRDDQLEELAMLWRRSSPSFVSCRGRRRIGKSTLIEHFAEISGAKLIEITGVPPQTRMKNEDQLASFGRRLGECFSLPAFSPASWFDAFRFLENELSKVDGRKVVLLDEISWMGKYDSNFPGELKSAWDLRFSRQDELVFVICGSVSSWITENILENTGFVGRISLDLVVRELPPSDCVKFWGEKAAYTSTKEILDMLSVVGGVPKYLDEMVPSLGTDENLRRMCFHPNGFLFRDFENIFTSVFSGDSPLKRRILALLANGRHSAAEIAVALGIPANGQLSRTLSELELAGFLAEENSFNPETGRRGREIQYRLRDNYTRFYLKYIVPYARQIEEGRFDFQSLENLPAWNSVLGLQFETLVLNNVRSLLPAMHLDGVQVMSAGSYRKLKDDEKRGVQVDLLIETRRTIHLVEIKRRQQIGAEIVDEMERKLSRITPARGYSLRTALVYDGDLAKSVRGSGYFDALVPAEKLLKT